MTPSNLRAAVRRELVTLSGAGGLAPELRELTHDLLAELSATAGGAPADPYFAHNLGVLGASLASSTATEKLANAILKVAAPLLLEALTADGDDLVLALALAHHAEHADVKRATLEAVVSASVRPHAGDRLTTAAARAAARQGHDAPTVGTLLARLDDLLAREPERESAARARIQLVALGLKAEAAPTREETWQRLVVLFEDAQRTFGADPDRAELRLGVITTRMRDRDAKVSKKHLTDALGLVERLAAESRPRTKALVSFQSALQARQQLKGEWARRMAGALRTALDRNDSPELQAALTDALEAAGDSEGLIAHHTRLVQSGQAGDVTREALARQWVSALAAGAPSGLEPDVESFVLSRFPERAASKLSPEMALALLEYVAQTFGPERAGRLSEHALLRQPGLAKDGDLVVRSVQLLADGGSPDRALKVGHSRLGGADSSILRLTLAKIHLGAGIRVAEAEVLVRPLASVGGADATEARALRDRVVAHPAFEEERVRAMLEVEKRLGVGESRPVRCRVIFPSDRYVLAEMPGAKAPAFYAHRYLRLMVNDAALPSGLSIGALPKGTEFTVAVIGEDDHKGDRIRVYWPGQGAKLTLLAKPPKAEKAAAPRVEKPQKVANAEQAAPQRPPIPQPTADQEARFNIGNDAEARVRISRQLRRGGLLLGHVLPPEGDGELFPMQVGIHRKFIPEELHRGRWRRGTIVRCQIARFEGADKLRYDATSMITLEWEPEPHASEHSAPSKPEPTAAAALTATAADAPADSIAAVTPAVEAQVAAPNMPANSEMSEAAPATPASGGQTEAEEAPATPASGGQTEVEEAQALTATATPGRPTPADGTEATNDSPS